VIGQPPVMPIYCSLAFGFCESTNCAITHPSLVAARGVGTISLQLGLGMTLKVQRVLYVSSMRVSVLSISTLEDQCYGVSFVGRGVYIHSLRTSNYDRYQ
jgi:hypothetical protein